MKPIDNKFIVRQLGLVDYLPAHEKMKAFTNQRTAQTPDEIWLLEHTPVFTLGRNANRTNFIAEHNIPVVQSDRGGDVTYHGPGQLVVYCLFDLKRLQVGVKALVNGLEEAIIQFLSSNAISAVRIPNAPGVYVNQQKIASLGLRVRKGCSYHGIAINVDMDLTPFSYINPCGLKHMSVTQTSDLGIQLSCDQVASKLTENITRQFNL
ncbi:MAG: lipoyl(octanoyl) transferase LipB [Pseudomonadota bacterium]